MPALTPAGLISRWNAATIGWNTIFRQVLAGTETYHQLVASQIPSNTREEDYPWLDRLPAMRKWEGERVITNPSVRLQTITNDKYELTVGVKREDIEDDKLGVFDPIVQEAARQAKVWPDAVVANAITAGTSAVVYDNQHFFDASHPVNPDDASQQVGGSNTDTTQANYFTGAVSGNYPGALPLNESNLGQVLDIMLGWVGPDGKPMNVQVDTIMVGPDLRTAARRLLQAELIATDVSLTGGTHGAAVQSNIFRGTLDLVVNPYLTEKGTWYPLCTKRALKPFIFQLREAPEFAVLTRPTDEHVFKQDEFLWGVRARGAAGYGQWFLASKCKAS